MLSGALRREEMRERSALVAADRALLSTDCDRPSPFTAAGIRTTMRVSKAVPKSPRSSPVRRRADDRESGSLPRTLKARSRTGDTTLQRHASFFDDNGDRGVDVAECTRGLKALGVPFGVAEAAALAIVAPSMKARGTAGLPHLVRFPMAGAQRPSRSFNACAFASL